MAVKKAKDASFKRMDSAYASSKSAIQKVKNADPLNAKEEQEQEEGNASVDPANYLSKKEKKEWKRLSYTAKQRYKKNWPFNTEVFKEAEKIAGQNGYKNPVYVSYDERNKKYITTRFESRLNYISKEEFTFFEEKAKEDSNIQTFQIDEEAFLYLNFNETPQPSLRELEKMVKEIQVAEVNEEEEEKETDQQPDILQDREQWDLSGDIIDCFRRYSSELSPEEQEEIIKGIEEGMTDQDVKRYFTLVGAEKMRQYRRVLMVAKIRDEDN